MDFVGEHFGFASESFVQVDEGELSFFCHFIDYGDDAFGDGFFVDAPAVLVDGNGEAKIDGGLARLFLEMGDGARRSASYSVPA